jgi:transcriptional regulator with XRE-family HTH domain
LAEIDKEKLRGLIEQGLSQREIARQLGIPRSSLQRALKSLAQVPTGLPAVDTGPPILADVGIPGLTGGPLPPEELERTRADFWAMLEWWRGRQAQQVDKGVQQKTSRATYHVENRWIDRIKREADLEGVTIAAVVNRAFSRYFEGK